MCYVELNKILYDYILTDILRKIIGQIKHNVTNKIGCIGYSFIFERIVNHISNLLAN